MYPLRDMLWIRSLREVAAREAVTRDEARVAQAFAAFDRQRAEFDAFRELRPIEEQRLYHKVIGRECSLSDLARLREDVAELRDREVRHGQAVLEAEAELERCRVLLQGSRVHCQAAVRALQKIEHHRDIWESGWARLIEQNEERELEEYSRARAENHEFDPHETH